MIVLDANIFIRAVLGVRAGRLLRKYAQDVEFVAPESVYQEANDQLDAILRRRGLQRDDGFAVLARAARFVRLVPAEHYSGYERAARERLARRDEDDWPVLALALAAKCPIWTEDLDFFGCGVATWTTDRVEIYFGEHAHNGLVPPG